MARRDMRPGLPSPMEDESSAIEERPRAASDRTAQMTGRPSTTKGPSAPAPQRMHGQSSSVGLRSAQPGAEDEEGPVRARERREVQREAREQHRQKVWDKLDAAKKFADEKTERYAAFADSSGAGDEGFRDEAVDGAEHTLFDPGQDDQEEGTPPDDRNFVFGEDDFDDL